MTDFKTINLAEAVEAHKRKLANSPWQPGTGEEIFKSRSGYRLQWMFQPAARKHAYYCHDRDLILTDEEAEACLAV